MKGDITKDNLSLVSELYKNVSLISAHFDGATLMGEKRFDFLTVARHPVHQLASAYAHIRREPQNRLHQASHRLATEKFFELFREHFENFQSRSLVFAFIESDYVEQFYGNQRTICQHIYEVLDNIRWVLPTESIDDFCYMLGMEIGVSFNTAKHKINVIHDNQLADAERARNWLEKHPEFYPLDELLYQESIRRFELYRDSVVLNHTGLGQKLPFADEAGMVFKNGREVVRVGQGWWQPFSDVEGWGVEIRAGPERNSILHVRRALSSRYLLFDLAFVAGVEPEELVFFDRESRQRFDHSVSNDDGRRSVAIDLADAPEDFDLVIHSPRIFPLAFFDGNWETNLSQVSFGSGNYRLAATT